ncbi:THUMP-like domain-containing protein [Robiginitalea myxolifaciens]|nr:class I SAM-dependent methyltransferase [Robiginitalea myxolifaciens]
MDLTGGLGVDAYFLSKNFAQVYHCEQDESLSRIAANNFVALGASHIQAIHANGLDVLKGFPEKPLDWVYADPSRRNAQREKVIRLEDYEPNILEHDELIRSSSRNFLLKTSPMLDISEGIRQLSNLREIHMVAVNNEMRELLWWLQPGSQAPVRHIAVNITADTTERFEFTEEELQEAGVATGMPENYLYEPNVALMKSGAFALIGQRYGLRKLHQHTHLYTSGVLLDFPGRRFRVEQVKPYKPGKLGVSKANISIRNFPETVARIRKRNKIADGGDRYLFFVRLVDDSLAVLFTSKA